MEEESELQRRVSTLEKEVRELKELVSKLQSQRSKYEKPSPKRRPIIGDLSNRVTRDLNQQADDELPRRQGPKID